jgi:hypothetical protein
MQTHRKAKLGLSGRYALVQAIERGGSTTAGTTVVGNFPSGLSGNSRPGLGACPQRARG